MSSLPLPSVVWSNNSVGEKRVPTPAPPRAVTGHHGPGGKPVKMRQGVGDSPQITFRLKGAYWLGGVGLKMGCRGRTP